MRNLYVALLITLLIVAGCGRSADNTVLVIHNGRLFDGTGADLVPDAVVAVQGDSIIYAGPAQGYSPPDNARFLDAQGGTIMPGLVDAHVHAVMVDISFLRQHWLENGVTSVRCLGSQYRADTMPKYKRQLAKAGNNVPTMVTAGPILTVPGGYPIPVHGEIVGQAVEADQTAYAVALELLDAGADVLKIAIEPSRDMPVFNEEQIREISAAAAERGTKVSAHISWAESIDLAIAGGVDDLAHFPRDYMSDEVIRKLVENDIYMVSTFIIREVTWKDQLEERPEEWAKIVNTRDDNLRRYLAAGGKVALGTDHGVRGIRPLLPQEEMILLQEAGMEPWDILVAATRHAAEVSNLGEKLGTLEEGKLADIIIVIGNPLEDLGAMDNIRNVVKNGEIVK